MSRPEDQPSGDDSETPAVSEYGEDFFEQIVSATSDGVLTANPEGTIVYANEAVEDLLGYSPEDLRGRSLAEFAPERFHERYDESQQHGAEGDDSPVSNESFEVTWQTADSEDQHLTVSTFEHEGDGKRLITSLLRETPEREVEDEQDTEDDQNAVGGQLHEDEALIEEIFETSPVAIAIRDADGELLRANDRAAKLAGIDSEGLPYDGGSEASTSEGQVYDPDGEPMSPDEFPVGRVYETGDPVYNEEVVLERPGHDTVYLSVSAAPIYEDGELRRVVSTAEDVTELKKAQLELERRQTELERRRTELETELSDVFERISDAFFALNDDWEFTYVNDEAAELLWRSESNLVGSNLWEEFPEAVDSRFQHEYERAMETQEQVSFVDYYPPLSKWFEVQAYPSETGLSVYFQDVTDRIERERELERYETIVETAEDGIYIVDDEGRLSMVNSSFAEMTGFETEEILGATPMELDLYDEDVKEQLERKQAKILAGEQPSATIELSLRTKHGHEYPAESKFVLLPTDDGHERIGILRDVTDRKERERELRERNERLDAFASMLAHELRNPLEIAQIYLGMGLEQAVDDDTDVSAFEEVEEAHDRIEEMIDTLLVVTRQSGTVEDTEVLNLGSVAEEWWESIERDGNLELETDRNIRADPSKLRQLLDNLYRNAEEHAGPDVTVCVGDLPDGFYVEDDGPGIAEDERKQVFDPGYSTSNVGIGFGLAVVRRLVDAHDWDCEITESESGGARFEFTGVETLDGR